MNITHLRYAVEIERSKYLKKAAENLYIAQPNLSRALKELEDSLGITIFKRTASGMLVTPEGEEFLERAKALLRQIDEMEEFYSPGMPQKQSFSISGPRASYISFAFSRFADKVDKTLPFELFYRETNSMRVISNMVNADYRLGILRFAEHFERYFMEMLEDKNLSFELIAEFNYRLLMHKSHPLADRENITFDELSKYTEIAHADPYVPSLSYSVVRKEELPDNIKKRIFVFERASQFELLGSIKGTFMWVSPMSQEMLDSYGFVQKNCDINKKIYKDILIYKKDYKLTRLDKMFIEELQYAKNIFIEN